jgi:hypothetical protein
MMEIKVEGLDKVLAVLHPEVYRKSLNRTVNNMGEKARTQMVKQVGKSYGMKASEIKSFMKWKKSQTSDLIYFLKIESKRRNVKRFSGKVLKKKGYTSVLIKKENGRKILRNSFLAKNGKAILHRVGNTQQIEGVYTISVSQMFNKKILKEADEMVVNEFASKFQSNFNFYIGNVKK